jgi:hypothetical protein
MLCILKFLIYHNKYPLILNYSYVIYDAVSLGIGTRRFETFYSSHIQMSTILRIFRFMKLCASIFRNVDDKLPVTNRHNQAVRILNIVDHIQDGTDWYWGTNDVEGNEVQDIKRILGINMCLWNNNIKMDIKENCFVCGPNYLLQNRAKRDFWKSWWGYSLKEQ